MSEQGNSDIKLPTASQDFVVAPRARSQSKSRPSRESIPDMVAAAKPGQKSQIPGWSDDKVNAKSPAENTPATGAATAAASEARAAPADSKPALPATPDQAAAGPAEKAADAGEGAKQEPTLSKQQLRKQQKLQARQQKQQQKQQFNHLLVIKVIHQKIVQILVIWLLHFCLQIRIINRSLKMKVNNYLWNNSSSSSSSHSSENSFNRNCKIRIWIALEIKRLL